MYEKLNAIVLLLRLCLKHHFSSLVLLVGLEYGGCSSLLLPSSPSYPQQCDTDDTRCWLLLQSAPRWSGISKQRLLKTSDLMSPTNKRSLCNVPIPHPVPQHSQSKTRCQVLLWGERFNCFCHACTSSFFSFFVRYPTDGENEAVICMSNDTGYHTPLKGEGADDY